MAGKSIILVTTAGRQIGTGHLRRCISLTEAIRARGGSTRLVLHDVDETAETWMRQWNLQADHLPLQRLSELIPVAVEAGAALVVDSYQVTAPWLDALQQAGLKVLVIDDLMDRKLPATWLTNCAVWPEPGAYSGLTEATLMLGPPYAILRKEFRGLRPRRMRTQVERILVTFGGSDPGNHTPRVINILSQLKGSFEVDVVVGPLARNLEECRRAILDDCNRFNILTGVESMVRIMCQADMAVSAAGQTLFELAAAGCPCVACKVADNQELNIRLFSRIGSASCVSQVGEDELLKSAVANLVENVRVREQMGNAGRQAVDGRGADRLAEIMVGT